MKSLKLPSGVNSGMKCILLYFHIVYLLNLDCSLWLETAVTIKPEMEAESLWVNSVTNNSFPWGFLK